MADIVDTIQRESSISFPFLGDWSINPPAYITLFGRQIYMYGIVIAFGFLLAILWCSRNSKRFNLTEDNFYDAVIWTVPLGILGARLYYVLFTLDYYVANPSKILAIWEGGLAIYGGIIAGALTIFIVCRIKKINPLAMLDLMIMGALIGQILGRWGNFFNREAFGAQTDIFCRMGLTAPNGTTIYVHPTFLYESLWNLAVFLILRRFIKKGKRKFDGQIILMYCVGYGLGRIWIEGLRTDSLYIGSSGIRVSQVLSGVLVIFGVIMLILGSKKAEKTALTAEGEAPGENAEDEAPAEGADEGSIEAQESGDESKPETEEQE